MMSAVDDDTEYYMSMEATEKMDEYKIKERILRAFSGKEHLFDEMVNRLARNMIDSQSAWLFKVIRFVAIVIFITFCILLYILQVNVYYKLQFFISNYVGVGADLFFGICWMAVARFGPLVILVFVLCWINAAIFKLILVVWFNFSENRFFPAKWLIVVRGIKKGYERMV